MNNFIHLHLHTEYSIIDSIVRIPDLINLAVANKMPAVAITDHNNLFGLVKFYKQAMKAGVKPIAGADINLENPADPAHPFRLLLLCQNLTGYRHLSKIISNSYIEGQHLGVPLVKKQWLQSYASGLIVLSGANDGDVGQALLKNNFVLARERAFYWQTHFPGRFYLELQRIGRTTDERYIQGAIKIAKQLKLPVVATNNVRFIAASDYEAHEARVCINQGNTLSDPKRPKNYTQQQYFRTAEEMARLFQDIPQALQNSVEIAKRCNLELTLDKSYLPDFPLPAGVAIADHLETISVKGLRQRLEKKYHHDPSLIPVNQARYDERLKVELSVINRMGFGGYFLIVADFIQWAKENGIPVGPGRGSGAGSLVAYVLRITDLDPLDYDLLFERFLNPERISMPDFDIDFCMDKRDRVIDYVAERYGRKSVSQIITFGTMAAKAVVRDVGRVLGLPYGFVDKLAKLIPNELGITLDDALRQEEVLRKRYDEEEDVKTLIDLALKLEGITRNAGRHAGGVVIAPGELTEFTPLYCEENGNNRITQFDKDDVEAVGLVKFDFLGLRTLTIIDWALQTINAERRIKQEAPIDIESISLDDKPTFDLLKRCSTAAVFQIESRGMTDLVNRIQPDCFEDIVPLVALFRPGPLQSGMVDDYINRKQGKVKIDYFHPLLEPVLRGTYGVILYQEQVMQIAQALAGYTLGSADILRKAMGKKKPEEMAKQREIFIAGAEKNNIDPKLSQHIFDLMEKFAGYGFNKSHSAAYALVAYQTAWLKAHYPAAFMAAVLSSDMDNTDKVVGFLEECKRLKLNVASPSVNQGYFKFTTDKQGGIIYGLGAVKGVGEAAIVAITQARNSLGKFNDLFEFCAAVEPKKINRRAIEALIKSGAMDDFGQHRASLLATVDIALKAAEQATKNKLSGQNDLFAAVDVARPAYVEAKVMASEILLKGEKESLGWYLSGHPLQNYLPELKSIIVPIAELPRKMDQVQRTVGLVAGVRSLMTKRNERMAIVSLDDGQANIDVTVFSDLYQEYRELLTTDRILVVEGEVGHDTFNGGVRLTAQRIFTLEEIRESYAKELALQISTEQLTPAFIKTLQNVLTPHATGRCPVTVHYSVDDASAKFVLGQEWCVHLADDLLANLRELCGEKQVVVCYE